MELRSLYSVQFNRPPSTLLGSWGMQYGVEAVKDALAVSKRRYSRGGMSDAHLINYITVVLRNRDREAYDAAYSERQEAFKTAIGTFGSVSKLLIP